MTTAVVSSVASKEPSRPADHYRLADVVPDGATGWHTITCSAR